MFTLKLFRTNLQVFLAKSQWSLYQINQKIGTLKRKERRPQATKIKDNEKVQQITNNVLGTKFNAFLIV